MNDNLLTSSVNEQIRILAQQYHEDAAGLANEAMAGGLLLVEKRRLFRAGHDLPEIENALRILRSAPDVPPMPGDELPENYKRHAWPLR